MGTLNNLLRAIIKIINNNSNIIDTEANHGFLTNVLAKCVFEKMIYFPLNVIIIFLIFLKSLLTKTT